jgi:hypothetical protein
VSEEGGNKSPKTSARERMLTEVAVLFVFAWIAAAGVAFHKPPPPSAYAWSGSLRILVATLVNGFEIFIFGYLLSRFFKQFKTGCAFVMILFFAYLLWVG